MKKRLFLLAAVAVLAGAAQAQQPYKHGVGGVVGTIEGVSYKTFFTENVALQADLGFTFGTILYDSYGDRTALWTFELNPNAMYEGSITGWNWGSLWWFAGGGASLGLARPVWTIWDRMNYGPLPSSATLGKFGLNAIGGVELTWDDIPLTVQVDFRPGYGLLFRRSGDGHASYFDWGLTAGVRYTF